MGQPLHSTALLDTRGHEIVHTGDAAWLLSTRFNGVSIHRSVDGETWTAADTGPPTPGESLRLEDLAQGSDGRLVAVATRGVRCESAVDVGEGYQSVGFCLRQAAAVLLSDDDGATWRRVDPAAMAPPGDSSVRMASVVATADGFVAAGTVAGPDWHTRLWSSPDGETWALEREVRGASPFNSVDQLLSDGSSLVLVLSEHPCAEPRLSTPGWVLGADWVEWPRVFSGTTAADLTPVAPRDHPFVRDLDVSSCDVLGTLEGVSRVDEEYPGMIGTLVGGVITLLEDPRPTQADLAAEEAEESGESDDGEAALTSGRRRVSQLVDGSWSLIEIRGVQSALESGGVSIPIDVDGTPGIFEISGSRDAATTPAPILPDGEGGWVQQSPEHAVLAEQIVAAGFVDGALVAVASVSRDPWADSITTSEPTELTMWTSRETTGPPEACELEPGAVCLFADLTQSPGYPDFAGIDLSGADLAYANLGAADLTGADVSGARLWGARSDEGFSADAANFSAARLQSAQLRSTVGADFTGADISSSTLYDASGAVFTDARVYWASFTTDLESVADLAGIPLARARITVAPPERGRYQVSLAGLDLTNARVAAPFDGPLLKVTSLDGAILDGTSLDRVDLSAIDPTLIDLSTVDVWDDESICPDGRPPDDLPIGTCVRAE